MRQLNLEEKKLTEKGIVKVKKDIEDLKEEIIFHEASLEFMKAKEKYESIVNPIVRKTEKHSYNKKLDMLKNEIKAKEYSLSEMNKQLTEGVKEKDTPKLVG